MVANGLNSINSHMKGEIEATRPTLFFVYKYRYRFALFLGFIIAFFPSLIFLFYIVIGL